MAETDGDFERLLEYLRDARGIDFTGYKRTSLVRRLTKRMTRVGINEFDSYLDYLQVHPSEFAELFDEVLINVTSFFRESDAWAYLASNILPELVKSISTETPLRCWCAGVASGAEAYTLAMLLAESIGTADFAQRVKIYATDVDDDALSDARTGAQTPRELEPVPVELRERYFEESGSRFVFRPDLRRAIIFGRHDLVQDAPISRLDLLICRNTLMYFTAETQKKVVTQFHYALSDTGYLFLGKAEMLLTHGDLFTPVDMRHRIFRKVPRPHLHDRLAYFIQSDSSQAGKYPVRVLEISSDAMPAAQVVVDKDGIIMLVNERARRWFRLNQRDVGRPLQDVEISYRPVELRSLIEKAHAEGHEVVVKDLERALSESEMQYLDVHVAPLTERGKILGASIAYEDVTAFHGLQAELERSRQELETAYEELQSTNEELETTNEELQSTVEELETTNEELQSSNEELETMNEELESTNSELQAINGELRQRTDEVEEGNGFFESVLTSLQLAVIVVDAELRVRLWRGRSEDMWGLRSLEVQDKPLGSLDIGLPLPEVRTLVTETLAAPGSAQVTSIDATNRRGRPIRCRVMAHALRQGRESPSGVILMIEEVMMEPVG